ncbi:hypothetical protein WMY93_022811 [Mugilogobius chulae]|uniref:DDE Tnp4 domain-containing protein n=1 Tax=Mugilogobius chulae TaxID=88201 RepID=A0AAW0NK97_9GOBI
MKQSLQPIDEFFLFMNYVSLDLVQKDLANRFKVHQSTVSRIINTWNNFLYEVLGEIGIWLDEETIKENLAHVFADYSDTHVILDCTELHSQTPDSLLLQSEVYSTYKSHSTFKGLIGIAPHGSVTFISPLYEGCISDREILKQSGLVSLLKPSMAIMVDKGFLVEDLAHCKVYIPALLKKKSQLSAAEVRKTQSIARLRVHVERVIRRQTAQSRETGHNFHLLHLIGFWSAGTLDRRSEFSGEFGRSLRSQTPERGAGRE